MDLNFDYIRKRDNKELIHTAAYRYSVYILKFYKWKGCQREVVKVYSNLRFEMLDKYAWFFRRKAALLQLENPKNVYAFQIIKEATKQELEHFKIKKLKNKIRSAKGKLTQNNRKLEKAKKEWSSLFPIEEDASYIRTIEYLRKKEFALNSMQAELKELIK